MRHRSLDIAKGIGIILVVMGHFFPDGSPEWYSVLRQVVYSFHMPMFIFISGFIFIYTRNDELPYGAVLKKKFSRIAVPYFVTSFAFIIIKYLIQFFGIYLKNPVTLSSFVKVIYYPEAAVSFWYLWALWWFFMIVPMFRSRQSRLVLLAVSLIFAYVPFDVPDIFALPKVKEMFPYFMLGAVVADRDRDLTAFRRIPSAVYFAVFAAAVLLWLCAGVRLGIVLALSGTASVICISSSAAKLIEKGRMLWLDSVSRASYMIYLIHPIFIAGVLAVIHKMALPLTDNMVFVPLMLFSCILGVVCPMIVDLTIKRIRRYGR